MVKELMLPQKITWLSKKSILSSITPNLRTLPFLVRRSEG